MRDIYVVSDTHFNHSNILKFEDADGKKFRGDLFSSVEEMNETMIQNWNSVVRDQDIVYHLGDVGFSHAKDLSNILSRLNGHKRLILGNHDDGKSEVLQKHFEKIMVWRIFKEFNCVLTHIPLHETSINEKVKWNVHGHTHTAGPASLRHINVCVEKTNYTPLLLEKVIADHEEKVSTTFKV